MSTLDRIMIGKKVIIHKIINQYPEENLLFHGILPGDQLEITAISSLGGPIAIRHRNNHFVALRKDHANFIQVQEI